MDRQGGVFVPCVFLTGAVQQGDAENTSSLTCSPLEKGEMAAAGEFLPPYWKVPVILVGNRYISNVWLE